MLYHRPLSMKTAIVHDWLVSMGGAERVLEAIVKLYPSPIYTLLDHLKLKDYQTKTSFLQKIPGSSKIYRNLLPLFPKAIESFDLSTYDLILSDSHAVAKGAVTHPKQLHICYCHTPMRYVWDLYETYLVEMSSFKRRLAKPFLRYLKKWDLKTLSRVSHFIANSYYVAERIKKNYGRDASVIYPPVATDLFQISKKKEEFYLTVARLVPYKKIDLIVEAFGHLPSKRLIVIGDGPEMARIKSKAKKNIELLGWQSDELMRDYMGKAKAFVFAADEDFGIATVEAQAAGTPVIAFGHGGSLETVTKETGLFFSEQSVRSIAEAIGRFEQKTFDPNTIRHHASRFSRERFANQYRSFVEQKWAAFSSKS